MLTVYRVALKKYINDLTGMGAFLYGGRWSPPGVNMLHASESKSLALLEARSRVNPKYYDENNFRMLELIIPSSIKIDSVNVKKLPKNWRTDFNPVECQQIGMVFATDKKYCVLEVPSRIFPDSYNYLINPFHSDFSKITFGKPTKLPVL